MNWWLEIWSRRGMIAEVIKKERVLKNIYLNRQNKEDLMSEIIIGVFERMIKSPFPGNSNISLDLYIWNVYNNLFCCYVYYEKYLWFYWE